MSTFKEFVQAFKLLRRALAGPPAEHREALEMARAGLDRWSAEVLVPRMIAELEGDSVEVHRAAIGALRSAGLDAIDAVPALMAFFERTASPDNSDVQNYARKEAAYAADDIMRKARQVMDEADRALKAADQAADQAAERAQQARGAQPAQTLEQRLEREAGWEEIARTRALLTDSTRDPDPQVRVAAIHALLNIGASAAAVGPVLRERLDDEAPAVRAAAVQALGQLRRL